MTGINWLYMAGLHGLIFFSIVIVTLAIMFGPSLLFSTHYSPRFAIFS
jgi:hypothetical protein